MSRYNKKKLQERVRNGPDVHPGANMIRMGDGSFVKSLAFGDREKIAKSLEMLKNKSIINPWKKHDNIPL